MIDTSDPALEARRLLRAARAGVLATSAEGQPFASLVTPATAADGSVLLLLSELSEHTRHLRRDPRCALIVTGDAMTANAQTAPRVTVTGIATLEADPACKTRWVGIHPYAGFYANFSDFHMWRIAPMSALFIGGFASAHRLRHADMAVGANGVSAAERGIISHCNDDHAVAMKTLALRAGLQGDDWNMLTCDVDGFDIGNAQISKRIHWPTMVQSPDDVRAALIRMVRDAGRP